MRLQVFGDRANLFSLSLSWAKPWAEPNYFVEGNGGGESKTERENGDIAKEQIYLHPRPIFVTREDFTSIEVFLLKFIVQKN